MPDLAQSRPLRVLVAFVASQIHQRARPRAVDSNTCWRRRLPVRSCHVHSRARTLTLFFGQSPLSIGQNFQSLGPALTSLSSLLQLTSVNFDCEGPQCLLKGRFPSTGACAVQQFESRRFLTSPGHVFNKCSLTTNTEPGTMIGSGYRVGSERGIVSASWSLRAVGETVNQQVHTLVDVQRQIPSKGKEER